MAGPPSTIASEVRLPTTLEWSELRDRVASLAQAMRRMGNRPGDRVVSTLPNMPEAMIALRAPRPSAPSGRRARATSARSILDRLRQIEPRLLFAADGYRFGGKNVDCHAERARLVDGLPTLAHLVFLPDLDPAAARPPHGRRRARGCGREAMAERVVRCGYIDGRPDLTLNRAGVRIGTAEVCRIVENVEGVPDSLVVNLELVSCPADT